MTHRHTSAVPALGPDGRRHERRQGLGSDRALDMRGQLSLHPDQLLGDDRRDDGEDFLARHAALLMCRRTWARTTARSNAPWSTGSAGSSLGRRRGSRRRRARQLS